MALVLLFFLIYEIYALVHSVFVQRSPKGITSPGVFYENITGRVKGREGKIERSTKVHKELSDERRRNTFTKPSVSEYICVREQVAR